MTISSPPKVSDKATPSLRVSSSFVPKAYQPLFTKLPETKLFIVYPSAGVVPPLPTYSLRTIAFYLAKQMLKNA